MSAYLGEKPKRCGCKYLFNVLKLEIMIRDFQVEFVADKSLKGKTLVQRDTVFPALNILSVMAVETGKSDLASGYTLF